MVFVGSVPGAQASVPRTPLKLLLVTQHFAPHFEGGTELVARAQARELARRGHDVRVVSGTDRPHSGADAVRETVDGLEVTFLPRHPDEPYDLALERPRLRARLADEWKRADVVHVHHWATLTGTLVRDAARHAPTVVTLHDLFVTCPRFFRVPVAPVESCPERGDFAPCARCLAPDAPAETPAELEAGLARRAESFRAELDAAARIVLPSRSHATHLARTFDLREEKTAIVAHGVCARFDAAAVPRLAYDGRGPLRVLFLGHRSELKGTRDLANALAMLDEARRGRVELVLLGGELEPGFDAELTAAAGDVRVTFGGGYRLDELPARLAAAGGAHLAALPSRVAESYGLVVDEALALGLPAWVSDRGAPPERVGDAGRVLPAEDSAAWRDAFRELLDRPDMLEDERRAVPAASRTAADAAEELDRLYRDVRGPLHS